MVKREEENTRANVAINGQDNTASLVYKFCPYDRIPAYVGTLLSVCRNHHCTSHWKTKRPNTRRKLN